MALIPTGDSVRTPTGENRLGHDLDGNRIVVSASEEATEDQGWPTIWQAAETKYDAGEFDDNGTTRVIKVTTAECAAERAKMS